MLVVSRQTEYALMVVKHLIDQKGGQVSVRQLSLDLKIPYRFLGNVLAVMGAAGIVVSREGKGGGYKLAEGWDGKNLYEFMIAMGESPEMAACNLGETECNHKEDCKLRPVWTRVSKELRLQLEHIPVSQV